MIVYQRWDKYKSHYFTCVNDKVKLQMLVTEDSLLSFSSTYLFHL